MKSKEFIINLGIGIGCCTILVTTGAAHAAPVATDVTNNLPGFIKQQEVRSRGNRACPPPLQTRWKVLLSPTTGMPWRDPADNPVAGTRGFGEISINELFSHTFRTESFKRGCCYISERGLAFLGVNGASSPTNASLFTGDVPNNDIFGTFGLGAIHSPPSSAALFGTPYPSNWDNWKFKQVSPVNVSSNNRFSYAIGDDMKIRQTVLYAQTCCIVEEKPRRYNNMSRINNASGNAFQQMMQRDGARRSPPIGRPAPRINTAPRVAQ